MSIRPHSHAAPSRAQIARDERRLEALGYAVDRTDGVVDAATRKAVAAFRRDDHFGRGGGIDPKLSALLGRDVAALNHAAYHGRVKPSREHARLDAATALASAQLNPDGTRGVGAGSPSRQIKNVQAHLMAAGFDPKDESGRWDARTQGALEAFQVRSGLPSTGRVDFATWSKLKSAYLYASGATRPPQAPGERSSAVRQTEAELRQLGYRVRTDGLFDSGTQRAVKSFERKHHLRTNGEVDARIAQELRKAVRANGNGALAQKILRIAQSQIGTRGMDGGGGAKYSHYFGRPAESYCADFVSWVYSHAGKPLNYAYVPYLEDHLKRTGKWSHTPKPGELVLFDWNGDGSPDHVGIVKHVNSDGSIETIEGNTTNPNTGEWGVWQKRRPRSEILGYGKL